MKSKKQILKQIVLSVAIAITSIVGMHKVIAQGGWEDFQTDGNDGSQNLTQAWGCEYTGRNTDICTYIVGNTRYLISNCKSTIPNFSNCGF